MTEKLSVQLAADQAGTVTCEDCAGATMLYSSAVPGTLEHWHEGEMGRWLFTEQAGFRAPGSGGFHDWTTKVRSPADV